MLHKVVVTRIVTAASYEDMQFLHGIAPRHGALDRIGETASTSGVVVNPCGLGSSCCPQSAAHGSRVPPGRQGELLSALGIHVRKPKASDG